MTRHRRPIDRQRATLFVGGGCLRLPRPLNLAEPPPRPFYRDTHDALVDARTEARNNRDFARADALSGAADPYPWLARDARLILDDAAAKVLEAAEEGSSAEQPA